MIFYEAPHKLPATLNDFLKYFGERKIVLVRELTKLHETVQTTTLSEAAAFYNENTPKGEFVVIVEGYTEETQNYTLEDAVKIAEKLVDEGKSTSSAAKEAAEITGIKKGEIYKALL